MMTKSGTIEVLEDIASVHGPCRRCKNGNYSYITLNWYTSAHVATHAL